MADPFAIETIELRKRYHDVEALRGLNLQVPTGSIYGFLGRNGAGKTTTIKVLLGLARPAGGDARVFGLAADEERSSVEIRRRTGFVSEEKALCDRMTVAEIIRFTAAFYPRWRRDLADRYLHAFDLPADRKVKALSRGMRTKLALLVALCRRADLLLLDEPTAGLDPAMIDDILQMLVRHVAEEETTIFFSSHQIAEVEQIADHVAILDRGRVAAAGALDDLRGRYRRIDLVFDRDAPDAAFRTPGVVRVRRQGRMLSVLSSVGADPILDEARAFEPASVSVAAVTLRDIFLDTVHAEA